MNARELFGSARAIGKYGENGVCIGRAKLFANIGRADKYRDEFDPYSLIVDVCPLLRYAQTHAGMPIMYGVLSEEFNLGKKEDREYARKVFAKHNAKGVYCSFVMQFKERYEIYVYTKNHCWARFQFCKELAHVITKTVSKIAVQPNLTAGGNGGGGEQARGMHFALADQLLRSADFWRDVIKDSYAPINNEAVGFFHAIEVLLPWKLRLEFWRIYNSDPQPQTEESSERAAWEDDVACKIAKRFMVPKDLVSYVLKGNEFGKSSRGLSYIKYSEYLNRQLDREEQDLAQQYSCT